MEPNRTYAFNLLYTYIYIYIYIYILSRGVSYILAGVLLLAQRIKLGKREHQVINQFSWEK